MQRYAAFLRAINVGGHVVKMETLRSEFEALGFTAVSTFIASGNVLFEAAALPSADLERQIEAALLKALGYPSATFVRSAAEVAAAAGRTPFKDMDAHGCTVHVVFLRAPLTADERGHILALNTDLDEFHAHDREIYWLCRTRMSDSPVFKRGLLDKAIRVPSTSRNMNTVRKLALKMG